MEIRKGDILPLLLQYRHPTGLQYMIQNQMIQNQIRQNEELLSCDNLEILR